MPHIWSSLIRLIRKTGRDMNYLTTPFTEDFNANTSPSYTHQVNGMATKTNAVKHALNCKVISHVDDLVNLPEGNLLIEPLFFKSHPESIAKNDSDTFDVRMDAVKAYQGRKMLLCSEMTPLRWFGKNTERIVAEMEYIFASCQYQSKLLEAIDLPVEKVVYEPVNEFLFYPAGEKKEWVVAIGSPTHVKNTEAILDIFSGLADIPELKTIFIGSPIVWGQITGMKNEASFNETMKNYERLKEVSDVFYTASSQIFVAYMLSQAKYYLNFAYHETCCRTAMEAMLAGVGILVGDHPLFDEYPCVASGLTPEKCVELLKTSPVVDVDALRKWALENVSYAAFQKNIEGAIK